MKSYAIFLDILLESHSCFSKFGNTQGSACVTESGTGMLQFQHQRRILLHACWMLHALGLHSMLLRRDVSSTWSWRSRLKGAGCDFSCCCCCCVDHHDIWMRIVFWVWWRCQRSDANGSGLKSGRWQSSCCGCGQIAHTHHFVVARQVLIVLLKLFPYACGLLTVWFNEEYVSKAIVLSPCFHIVLTIWKCIQGNSIIK